MDPIHQSRAWVRWQRAWLLAAPPGVCLAVLMWGRATTAVCVTAAVLVVGAVALTSPWARGCLAGRLEPGHPHRTGTWVPRQRSAVPAWARCGLPDRPDDGDGLLAVPAATMTTQQLCRAWRHSFAALRHSSSPERARLAALRQSYLDEIERRNPGALQAWFAAGARAASGPERFLAPRRPRPPAT